MKKSFSKKVTNLKPSAIREIFKYASDPNFISFSAGNPSNEAFPKDTIAEITSNLLKNDPALALQYNITEGYLPLRQYIKTYLKLKYDLGTDFDDIMITSGAQQAIELTAKLFCDEGDVVICENPSFIGALNAFRSYKAKLCGIDMNQDGMDIEKLERVLKKEKKVKFIYTIPNFQNPSGITMSLEKRKALYNLSKKYSVFILEDNPYGELRFYDEDIPSIKSMDEDGIVIYVGSFSKVLSPGLRVGYMLAPKEIVKKAVVCKQCSDVHTNILSQLITYEFIKNYDYDSHILFLKNLYRKKAEFAMSLCDKFIKPALINYNKISGGFFLWCNLPEGNNAVEFSKKALEKNVCIVPGNTFLIDEEKDCNCFRMNFSTPTDSQLKKGIEILGSIKL